MGWLKRQGVDRMDNAVSHTSAVIGGVALVVMVGCGVLSLQDRRMVYSMAWWMFTVPSVLVFTGCVLSYLRPASRWALVPMGLMGAVLLYLVPVIVISVGRRHGMARGSLAGVVLGVSWVIWAGKQWADHVEARREKARGFEVVEGDGD